MIKVCFPDHRILVGFPLVFLHNPSCKPIPLRPMQIPTPLAQLMIARLESQDDPELQEMREWLQHCLEIHCNTNQVTTFQPSYP